METQIHEEITRYFYDHLADFGSVSKIDLFLYSRGGMTLAPWRLVTLLREHCDSLGVLVPYKAHSAATMICLGADELILGEMAQLSPIDPSVANPFNPEDPKDPSKKLPIAVEEVTSYLALAKERAGLADPERMLDVFKLLVGTIHPLALGNVHRSHSMIRQQTRKLLLLRLDPEKDEVQIQNIINGLIEQLYVHGHMINRKEAAEELRLGNVVEEPVPGVEEAMWALYEVYEADLELNTPFVPAQVIGDEAGIEYSCNRSFVESLNLTDAFVWEGKIRRVTPEQITPQAQIMVPAPEDHANLLDLPINVSVLFEGWRRIRSPMEATFSAAG